MSGRILALETTGGVLGAAVCENGAPLARAESAAAGTSAERLLELVDEVLERSGTPPHRIDRVVADRGPGSFTGIRVGLATARALGLGWARPVEGVTASEALLAQVADFSGAVLTLIDVRRDEVCAQLFGPRDARGARARAPLERSGPGGIERLLHRARAEGWLASGLTALGSGLGALGGEVSRCVPGAQLVTGVALDACAVARAAAQGWATSTIDPVYARPPDARLPDAGGAP